MAMRVSNTGKLKIKPLDAEYPHIQTDVAKRIGILPRIKPGQLPTSLNRPNTNSAFGLNAPATPVHAIAATMTTTAHGINLHGGTPVVFRAARGSGRQD